MKTKKEKIEAYGVKGMKSTSWRKSFNSSEALDKWAEKNDAQILGYRYEEEANE